MKTISMFEFETGRWDEKSNEFVDRKFRTEPRELEMKLETRSERSVLVFVGGPTGFESYYVDDLMIPKRDDRKDFCICGGTINSWPRCIVKWSDVIDFLIENNHD